MDEQRLELELHLKALGCFANPRNHPRWDEATGGSAQDSPRDLRGALRAARAATQRATALCRACLGDADRLDPRRAVPLGAPAPRADPADGLLALRRSLTLAEALFDGLLASERVSRRSFLAALCVLRRDVDRNEAFGPLVALDASEDRGAPSPDGDVPDAFDARTWERVTDADARVELSLALRSCAQVERYAAIARTAATRDGTPERSFVLAALAREAARSLERRVRERAPETLADGFERTLLAVSASEVLGRFDALSRESRARASIANALRAMGRSVRARARVLFEGRTGLGEGSASHASAVERWCDGLRVFERALRSLRIRLIDSLPCEPGERLSSPWSAEDSALASAGLREDVWMFARVTQAFIARARAAQGGSVGWTSPGELGFARRFGPYAREFEPIAERTGLTEPLREVRGLLDSVAGADALDQNLVRPLVVRCEALHRALLDAYVRVDARPELRGIALDRRSAAEALARALGP
jgi:hypothetical protein